MTQHPAAYWDCDAPNCNGTDAGQVDEAPFGWGFLSFDGRDMDLCDACILKLRKELGDL